MSLETRLSKLEEASDRQLNAPQIIILKRNQNEDLDAILAANKVTCTGHDLIISVSRGLVGEVPFLPFDERIISIQQTAARAA
jgi:hypothetical protein